MGARRALESVVDDHDSETGKAEQNSDIVAKSEFRVEENERNHHRGRNTHSITQHNAENGCVFIGLDNETVS